MMYAAKCLRKTFRLEDIVKECEFIRKIQREKAIHNQSVKRYNITWPDSNQLHVVLGLETI